MDISKALEAFVERKIDQRLRELGVARRRQERAVPEASSASGRPPSIQSRLRSIFKKVGTEVPRETLMQEFRAQGQKESSVVTMMYDLRKMENPINIKYDRDKDTYRRVH